ncbi:ribonuclease H family protein [Millisia brevis]|uniref:ribonuclease H family protein n=1 Tax=Millisia brevis TaxID=264148 RepID=UPI0009FFD440|nr:ribonuclease H [Millisia brevis]
MIIVSTDGSCLRNPGGAVGWAWVNHQGPTASGGATSGTNQVAELTAVLEALRAHPGAEPMVIETDSQYAVNCATEWLPGWKRRGWKTASGSPVSNRELIVAIDRELSSRTGPVRFRWVRGHVGNHYNEMADRLAGAAARDVANGSSPADAPVSATSPGSTSPGSTSPGSTSPGSTKPSGAAKRVREEQSAATPPSAGSGRAPRSKRAERTRPTGAGSDDTLTLF